MKTEQIAGNGWNTAYTEQHKHISERISDGYRTIKAETIHNAIEYMNTHYTGIQDSGLRCMASVWYEPCHRVDSHRFSFIVKRKLEIVNNLN